VHKQLYVVGFKSDIGQARAWYEKFGFEPSPTDPLHLMILIKDLRAVVES